jgi:outer membrane protein assembly factor BamB
MEYAGVGGVSVANGKVYCSGKTGDGLSDLWLCLDAATGREIWRLAYPASGKMDYTSSPRASPVLAGGRAFLMGAFGMLHAVRADTGSVLWKCDLPGRFGGNVPTWGLCATPLVVDGEVIVPTGSPSAALAALDVATGKPVWLSPGRPPGYGNPVLATLGARRQIVWHDRETLGGWDPQTGRRLWTVRPPEKNDFNVPTPVPIGDSLLVATENNGTRLYGFSATGMIAPKPQARSDEARPDTASPVVVDGVAWEASQFGLYALDVRHGLKTLWKNEEPSLLHHASIIGAPGRVLVITLDGMACVLPSRPTPSTRVDMRRLPVTSAGDEDDVSVWSHPAVVGNRLFVRTNTELLCIGLD